MGISERFHIHNRVESGKNRKIRKIDYLEDRQIQERNRARVDEFIKLHPTSELPNPTPKLETPILPGVVVKKEDI